MRRPRNLCVVCGEDFGSVALFDRHRVGRHEYLYAEGLAMEPPREDGRRCLDAIEMRERGWELDGRGLWVDRAKLEATRQAFRSRADSRPQRRRKRPARVPATLGRSVASERDPSSVPTAA